MKKTAAFILAALRTTNSTLHLTCTLVVCGKVIKLGVHTTVACNLMSRHWATPFVRLLVTHYRSVNGSIFDFLLCHPDQYSSPIMLGDSSWNALRNSRFYTLNSSQSSRPQATQTAELRWVKTVQNSRHSTGNLERRTKREKSSRGLETRNLVTTAVTECNNMSCSVAFCNLIWCSCCFIKFSLHP